ncbi:uncharacterized protein LOC143281562 [Babylonia areolata]|uniref:uncharacterized protein LOC143281562 n=1 Tax=Babylonia areolata TaxID=304850 RepID=UPI003FCEF4EC
MLRQYQTARDLGGSGGGGGGGGAGVVGGADGGTGWALKDSRDVIPSGQVRPMSTKILAVGVVLVGVLVLSVALIMGLEFPKYVYSQFREDQCVVHGQHSKFSSWRDGSQWRREVRLYYQHVRNPEEFLYHGAHPVVEERGPYVYEERETREDVQFSVTEVTYRLSRSHHFSDSLTAKECPACTENDTLTVVNTDYLRKMHGSGGHANHLLSLLPATLSHLLQGQGFLHPDLAPLPFPPNISLLGCLHSACDSSLPEEAAGLSFGRWLRTRNDSQASVVLSSRSGASFTASETGAVYRMLLNASVLGSDVFGSRSPAQTLCQTWAHRLCQGLDLPDPSTESGDVVDFSVCGLVHILRSCGGSGSSSSSLPPEVEKIFVSALCESPNGEWCLDLGSVTADVLSAYFQVFQDYVLLYLLQVIHDYVITQNNRDLLVTRPQRELALGYYVTTGADQSATHVPGLLVDYWLKSPGSTGAVWKVNTCLKDRNMNNNMKVREFGGSQFAPQGLMRDDGYSVQFSGRTDFFPACKPVSCCACAAPGRSVHYFLPSLQRALSYTDPVALTLWDTDLFRYRLSKDAFSWSSHYDVSCGLQRMTSSLGYVGWLGLPGLTMGQLESVGSDLKNCSLPSPQSFMDIEPVTGRVWRRVTQLQLNAGIGPDDVTGPRWRPLNVTYLLKAVPVVWTERKAILSDGELGYYNHKVERLLRVSCGGLIGLSVLAVMVAGVGVVIFFHPKKVNRVTPAVESDISTSNLHSRHLHPT